LVHNQQYIKIAKWCSPVVDYKICGALKTVS